MTNSPIINKQLLTGARFELERYNLRKSLSMLKRLADKLGSREISKNIDSIEARYFYMLRFIADHPSSAKMSEIKSITDDIKSILSDLDRAIESQNDSLYASQLRFESLRPEENIQSIISDYLSEAERLRTDVASLTDSRGRSKLERLACDIFNRLWTAYRLDSETARLIADLIDDESIQASHRELWVNALGLALCYYREPEILDIMYGAVRNPNRRICISAAVWLIIIAGIFHDKLEDGDYPAIVTAIEEYANLNLLDIYKTILNNIKGGESDFFMDIAQLSQRLKGIDPSNPESIKNIDLSSDDYDRINRFNKAQAGGADVFGNSIGRMRHFPFFAQLPNWFLPFDTQHSALAEITDGEGAEIAESIAMMPTIADSDKYALLLSMSQMPASMRNQAMIAMVDSMRSVSDTPEYREAMSELSKIPDSALIANQIHTLMRFVNFFAKASEFPFVIRWTPGAFLESNALSHLMTDDKILDLAGYTAKVGLHDTAIELFESIENRNRYIMTVDDYEAFAGLLAAYKDDKQSLAKASEYLALVLQNKRDRKDLAVKLAKVYLELDNPEQCIQTLQAVDLVNSNESDALALLADAYIAENKFAEAIEILHQIDYIQPENKDAKYKLARTYLLDNHPVECYEIIADIRTDNSGHAELEAISLWLSGHTDKAISIIESVLPADEEDAERHIDDLAKSIAGLSPYPVGRDSAYAGLLTLPDVIRYRLQGSQFGNL